MNAAPTLGALPAPPRSVLPLAPRGSVWRQVPASGVPRAVALAVPLYVASDGQFVYARAVVPGRGGDYLVIRMYPRASQLRTHFDHFYFAPTGSGSLAAPGLGAPPAGRWESWSGALPTPVGVAFATGRTPGHDFRATVGDAHWLVRADAHGAASYGLGNPPHERRITVSAWRWIPSPASAAATPSRSALRPVSFLGDPANPWPPAPAGWAETTPDDDTRARFAGLLGELPPSHYVDVMTPTGLWRFFSYETGAGTQAIGSLRYWGSMLGAGATLGDVATDKSTLDGQIAAGDQFLVSGNPSAAVSAYQSAGNFGATTLGPEIDAHTGGASKPVTQQAWGINTTLATIPVNSDLGNAQNAQGLAQQMKALYEQAIAMGQPGMTPQQQPPGTGSANTSAAALVLYFSSHPCTQQPLGIVSTFQNAYNASGLGPQVTPDGKYGALTQAAVQLVLDFANGGPGLGGQAPANCFTGRGGGGGGGGGTTHPVQQAGMSTGGVVATVLGVAAVVGAIGWAAYTGNLPSLTTSPS